MYPIAVAAALVIGGFLCCLVILQSSKEAAILRVLGTTKRKTRTMLALEQIVLGVIGLAAGSGGLIIYKGAALSGIRNQILLFIALYVAVIVVSAAVSASLATRRNVLELLQTKE
jgi:ABC-type antimicrobial peptide transport system permease subunit